MREFQEKRRLKKLLHSRYAIIGLVLLCGLLTNAVWSVYGKYERSKEIAERTKSEFAAVEAREKSLMAGIADLDTDLGKEREIRERFGVVREGERMIVLIENEDREKDILPLKEESLWQKFIGIFRWD